ncbi:helix-turn-helix domain-containing protein [Streptomyces sp. NPDC007264]|uniref:helix-turn-helix domain-containing protein n=1 Tax=Streptomyces sp. NPDC007264 TaxID=3364777 RepID=UPI0036D7E927
MTQRPAAPLPAPEERRRLREAGSLTRAQVAERLGVPSETVCAWETGRTVPRGAGRREYARLLAELATGRPAPPLTAPQAFDDLYAFCAPTLVRQAYLLTGRRDLARDAVERAFQLAWQRWPEVAVDPDPAGWVRALAHDCALSPWHRFRRRYRRPEPPPADPSDRLLLHALLGLPPVHRRTLVLHDGVGLGLPDTAAETEASTPAAAARLLRARRAVAAVAPELADPETLHRRLARPAPPERLGPAGPASVRADGERLSRRWTGAAVALTGTVVAASALTLATAPDHYEAPVPRGTAVRDIPARAAQGPLSAEQLHLRARLRAQAQSGPTRVAPEAR